MKYTNGLQATTRALSSVSGIPFSVSEEGTTALCDLSFTTDLNIIQSTQISCRTLYDLVGNQVNIGQTTTNWTFFADIGGEVFKLEASLAFNPEEETITSLIICLSPTCSLASSSTATSGFCLNQPVSSSSHSSSSSKSSSSII